MTTESLFSLVGERISIDIKATDPENRRIKYNLLHSSSNGSYVFSSNGALSITKGLAEDENITFVFSATDECNGTTILNTTLFSMKCACKNKGVCFPDQNRERGSGHYNCSCPENFTGNKCEDDVNECLTTQCENNGNCINTVGSYYCNCTERFNGRNCSEDIDECLNNPCKFKATCSNTIGGIYLQLQRPLCEHNWKFYV